jgi:peroxiredoxin
VDDRLTPILPCVIAPDFMLRRGFRLSLTLHHQAGQPIVLTFYPAALEPVSQEQLTLLQEYLPQFEELSICSMTRHPLTVTSRLSRTSSGR